MAKRKPTPEEQLLNLIEKEEEFKTVIPKRRRFSPFGFFSLRKIFFLFPSFKRFLRNELVKLKVNLKEPDLKIVNRILVLLAVILSMYLATDFNFRRPDIKQIDRRPGLAGEPRFKDIVVKEPSSFLYYLEMVQRRNIFSALTLETAETSEEEAKKVLSSLAQDLALVGISWGAQPQAMIEDKKTNKTYFLKSGDMINELKIEGIMKDRVILIYEGQKIELM